MRTWPRTAQHGLQAASLPGHELRAVLLSAYSNSPEKSTGKQCKSTEERQEDGSLHRKVSRIVIIEPLLQSGARGEG